MKRIHKSRRKSSHHRKRGFERFLTPRLFIMLGIIFLLTGIYYSLSSSGGSNSFNNMVMNLFKPSIDAPTTEVIGNGLMNLLIYFLTAILALIASGFYSKKFPTITYPASLVIAIYLIVIQAKIIIINFNWGFSYYPTFLIASLFLFIPVLLFFGIAILHRKSTILILACLYFYFSVVIFAYNYSGRFDYLFPFVALFSIQIAWVSQKIERPYINLINFAFAIGYFGLFWLRKFVVNSKPDFLIEFFTFGILFYLLFYAIVEYASNAKERPLPKWIELVLVWSNLFFFLITTSFVLFKYYDFSCLWKFVTILLIFNLIGIRILKRRFATKWTLPYHSSCMLLIALILPLFFHYNMVMLFTGGLTILLLIYANAFRGRISMWGSLVTMISMIVYYFFYQMGSYLPALFAEHRLTPDKDLLWHGVFSGFIMIATLFITKWLELKVEIPLSKKWFSGRKYYQLTRGLLLFSLFFTMGWIGFSLICLFTGTTDHSSVGWFISGSLFFIFMINYYSKRQSDLKKTMLYLGFLFALLYPLLVHWSLTITRDELIHIGNFDVMAYGIHYFALGLFVVLCVMTISRIIKRNAKNLVALRSVQIVTIVMVAFLLFTEYDNLSILIASAMDSDMGRFGFGDKILNLDQHLPYSILMWIVALIVFIWSVFKHDRFLRSFAMVVFIGILIKVFAYDFESLSQGEQSGVFIGMGLFIIGFAWLYPRILKDPRISKKENYPLTYSDKKESTDLL